MRGMREAGGVGDNGGDRGIAQGEVDGPEALITIAGADEETCGQEMPGPGAGGVVVCKKAGRGQRVISHPDHAAPVVPDFLSPLIG